MEQAAIHFTNFDYICDFPSCMTPAQAAIILIVVGVLIGASIFLISKKFKKKK